MKFRRTSARIRHQRETETERKSETVVEKDPDIDEDSTSDDVVFKQIVEPFSPGDCTDSDEADKTVDENWTLSLEKPKNVKTHQELDAHSNVNAKKPKTRKRTPSKRNIESVETDSDIELELEAVIDDERELSDVKGVLEQFPALFVKGYIKYLHAAKDSNTSKVSVPKKKNITPYTVVKENNPAKKCVICKLEFENNKMLAPHMRQHSTPDGFKCICKKVWKDFKGFWTHVVRGHGQMYKCPYCDLAFEGLSILREHSQNVHSPSYAYLCSMCDKGFSKEFRLLEHMNLHTGLKPHQCHLCGRTYRCADTRREHIGMRHSGTELKCSKCDKVFLCKRTFGDHILSHGTERKYICKECGKSFKTRVRLAHHRECHRRGRFKCDFCSLTFPSDTRLSSHCERKHSDPLAEKKGKKRKKKDSSSLENKSNEHNSDTASEMQDSNEIHHNDTTRISALPKRSNSTVIDDAPSFLDSYELQVNSEPLFLSNTLSNVMEVENDSSDDEKSEAVLLSL